MFPNLMTAAKEASQQDYGVIFLNGNCYGIVWFIEERFHVRSLDNFSKHKGEDK